MDIRIAAPSQVLMTHPSDTASEPGQNTYIHHATKDSQIKSPNQYILFSNSGYDADGKNADVNYDTLHK